MPRTKIEVDLKKVEEFAQVCDNEEEIALALGISYPTLRRRKKDSEQFDQAIKRGKAKANAFVGGKLMQLIKEGNPTDKPDHEFSHVPDALRYGVVGKLNSTSFSWQRIFN